jgi:two-component system OmpR family sensor kinase
MFTKSIRGRLLTWLAFLLVCILTGFGVTAYQLHRTNRFGQIDNELEIRVAAIRDDLRSRLPGNAPFKHFPFEPGGGPGGFGGPDRPGPGPGQSPGNRPGGPKLGPDGPLGRGFPEGRADAREVRLSGRTQVYFDETDTNGFYFVVWSRAGSASKRSTNAPTEVPRPERLGSDTGLNARTVGLYREAYQFTGIGECVLVGQSLAADLTALQRYAWWLVGAGLGVLGLGLWGAWLVASRAIRPVDDISAAATRISAGNLSERINVADTDSELGRLATILNSTFARLEAAFAQQKQFTADASHELRTPLSVIITEAQTTLARDRSAPEYRETVQACLDAAQQMRRLTKSMLELARFDAGQEAIERQPFDLGEQARTCIDLIRPLAQPKGITIHADLHSIAVTGDADRLSQVLVNLLSNAIHYNRDQGEISVVTKAQPGAAVVEVSDTGPGIPAEDLPRVFERFYRGDKARGRRDGHAGLGLSICKAIVDAHGGSIEVTSSTAEGCSGTTFTVRLPA